MKNGVNWSHSSHSVDIVENEYEVSQWSPNFCQKVQKTPMEKKPNKKRLIMTRQ